MSGHPFVMTAEASGENITTVADVVLTGCPCFDRADANSWIGDAMHTSSSTRFYPHFFTPQSICLNKSYWEPRAARRAGASSLSQLVLRNGLPGLCANLHGKLP